MLQNSSHFNSVIPLEIPLEIPTLNESYIFIEDTRAHHYRWSHNAVEAFGLEGECFESLNLWSDIIKRDDLEEFNAVYQAIIDEKEKQMCCECRIKMENGEYIWMNFNVWSITSDEASSPVFTGTISSINPQNASIDTVTGLKGNYEFRMALAKISKCEESRAVLILGIDEFKEINDLYSYSLGDRVLTIFAQKIMESIPANVLAYRLDGDGFGLLFPSGEKKKVFQYYHVLQKLAQSSINIDGNNISLRVSGGVSTYPYDGNDCEVLYRNARMALRYAKSKGKNQLAVFSDEILMNEHFKMQLLGNLRKSIKMDFQGFSLRYQPLIRVTGGDLYGCEALLRFDSPAFPQGVSPFEFIPILEESGLIIEVGKWVFEAAVKQCVVWGKLMPNFQMSINVSSAQFEDPGFKFFVLDILEEYGVSSSMITLELTESGKILDPKEMQNVFEFIRGQGIKIAFDDFGTGYASLSIFRVLSADELKIDGSFLERISYNVTDQKIVTQIVNLCHSMNMTVCVEGIETQEMEAIVKQFNPEFLQGYYYNRPLTADAFEAAYFTVLSTVNDLQVTISEPERDRSMVYAPFRPAQPMSIEAIVDNAHAGIFQVGMDQDFTFLTCNEGYRRMLGYTAHEVEVKFRNHALDFVYSDDIAYVNEEIRRQLSLGDTVTIEFRVVKSDGHPIWILSTGNVVKSKHGATSLVMVVVDNDHNKKNNLKMECTHQFSKKILDNIATGIKCVRFDADFTLEYISPGFLAILGYSLEDIETLFKWKYINMIYEEDRKIVTNDILEQLKVSNIVTMHYRSKCKDGKLIWVETISQLFPPDNDGIQRAYSSVVGITDSFGEQAAKRSLSIANRYHSALQQWGEVLFEYDFQSGVLSYSDNYKDVFGRKSETTIHEELPFVHEEDRAIILDVLRSALAGNQPQPVEVRIQIKNGDLHWYSIMFTRPEKWGDVLAPAIGKLKDIDAEKKERDNLLIQSQCDSMTGLLNKGSVEAQVRKVLSNVKQGQYYALYLIDIDNLKKINDEMGHVNGDHVICEIASRIQNVFGDHNIIGHTGGDAFLAFIPYAGSHSEIIKNMECLVERLHQTVMIGQEEYATKVNVGIACYPYDGTEFYDLFCFADSAIYRAKELGKDAYYCAENHKMLRTSAEMKPSK